MEKDEEAVRYVGEVVDDEGGCCKLFDGEEDEVRRW